MAGNPRENVKDKGFWEGGSPAHSENGQTGGRPSGFPGQRVPGRVGVWTDVDFPPEDESEDPVEP